jgi:hypothetical protein
MRLSSARSALIATGILAAMTAYVAHARADTLPNGVKCIPQESQSWWMTTPGKAGTQFGHVHNGACMPWGQKVSGKWILPVTIIMHDNPGKFQYFNPVYKTDSLEDSSTKNFSLLNRTCPVGTCSWTVPIEIDSAKWNYSGLQELRIRSYTKEPDGKIMHSSINVFVDVQNGKTKNDMDRKRFPRGKGWYTGFGYCEADITTFPVMDPVTAWAPTAQVIWHGSADDRRPSGYTVSLDSDAHHGIPGTVLAQGPGELQPRVFNLSGLAPGRHKLAIKADCDTPLGSTNSGVLAFWFDVVAPAKAQRP